MNKNTKLNIYVAFYAIFCLLALIGVVTMLIAKTGVAMPIVCLVMALAFRMLYKREEKKG